MCLFSIMSDSFFQKKLWQWTCHPFHCLQNTCLHFVKLLKTRTNGCNESPDASSDELNCVGWDLTETHHHAHCTTPLSPLTATHALEAVTSIWNSEWIEHDNALAPAASCLNWLHCVLLKEYSRVRVSAVMWELRDSWSYIEVGT